MSFKTFLSQCQTRIDQQLNQYLDQYSAPDHKLKKAMAYSLFNGGKRVRPVLVYATAEALGSDLAIADGPAMAIEMIHSYSLVHDDLPAMDDDDLRRGKPTCHIQFDEATAILAGDALQTLGFEVLSNWSIPPQTKVEMIQTLAIHSGLNGMAGGQSIDLQGVGKSLSLEQLELMHNHKTGALIRASVRMGALCGIDSQSSNKDVLLVALDQYAQAIGLAFQVQDDILDLVADTETLGKPQGSDQAANKPTYPALLGLEGAKSKLNSLHETALDALTQVEKMAVNTERLKQIADYIVQRSH